MCEVVELADVLMRRAVSELAAMTEALPYMDAQLRKRRLAYRRAQECGDREGARSVLNERAVLVYERQLVHQRQERVVETRLQAGGTG